MYAVSSNELINWNVRIWWNYEYIFLSFLFCAEMKTGERTENKAIQLKKVCVLL